MIFMGEDDWGYICCLVNESGGEVYQYQRLVTGVYALTNSLDRRGEEQIFNYSFQELAPFGPSDRELSNDIISLDFLGLIKIERTKREKDKLTHSLIKLTEKGIPETFSMEKEKSNVTNSLLQKKKAEAFSRYIEKLKEKTEIKVDNTLFHSA